MPIQVIRKVDQATGQFNGGEILENKPIGFPREGGILKPYSNIFYWAHAWSDNGSTIGLHPHQGFEILSFVLEGTIEHFDTAHNEWKKLDTGAAQIIRSGSGISHSEKINPGSHMFQIWFDPGLQKSMLKRASYNDYPNELLPTKQDGNVKTKVYRGEGSPLEMDTAGIEIVEKLIGQGESQLSLDKDKIHSVYVVKGEIDVEGEILEEDDFFTIQEETEMKIKVGRETQLFMISSPIELTYKTYRELYK